jgi:hypothetical protein
VRDESADIKPLKGHAIAKMLGIAKAAAERLVPKQESAASAAKADSK